MKRIHCIHAIALLALLPAGSAFAQRSPARPTSTTNTSNSPSAPAPMATRPATTTTTTAKSPASSTTTTTTAMSPAPSSPAPPSNSPAPPAARTDVYLVHFTHAAPGKANALADSLKQPAPDAPMPGHTVIFRHQDGDSWDYALIQHMGTKATIDAARPAQSPAARDASDWHTDTYASGPAWADFAKAMGIGEGAGKSAVYIVSVYRTVPGHREQLETELTTQTPGDPAAGTVLLQHLDGAAWTFLGVVRYATWEDFVKSEAVSAAEQAKGGGGWARLRDHSSYHTDTLTDRIAP